MTKLTGEKGVFLSEAVFSLLILTTVMLLSFPLLVHTYRERQFLQQKNEAVSVLRYHLLQWKTADPTFSAPITTTDFRLEWVKKDDHTAYLCVQWSAPDRDQKLCSEAKK
ncbi:type II secretion system protein [Sporolactobacillus sp. THM7-4]|nr:type II secretion system protein [Sporolactobacillus sp. THM7-4]